MSGTSRGGRRSSGQGRGRGQGGLPQSYEQGIPDGLQTPASGTQQHQQADLPPPFHPASQSGGPYVHLVAPDPPGWSQHLHIPTSQVANQYYRPQALYPGQYYSYQPYGHVQGFVPLHAHFQGLGMGSGYHAEPHAQYMPHYVPHIRQAHQYSTGRAPQQQYWVPQQQPQQPQQHQQPKFQQQSQQHQQQSQQPQQQRQLQQQQRLPQQQGFHEQQKASQQQFKYRPKQQQQHHPQQQAALLSNSRQDQPNQRQAQQGAGHGQQSTAEHPVPSVGIAKPIENGHRPVAYQPVSKTYAIDVECIATGTTCRDRSVGQIAVVDIDEKVVLNLYVRPRERIVSCLSELTGLTPDLLEEKGMTFEQAMDIFRRTVTSEATLISYNIDTDLQWLGLKEKVDYKGLVDVKGLYQKDPDTGRYTWPISGQDHLARVLLGWPTPGSSHDAAGDALKSMKLFHLMAAMEGNKDRHRRALEAVRDTPKEPSFAMRHPMYDGVCMGNKKTCKCTPLQQAGRRLHVAALPAAASPDPSTPQAKSAESSAQAAGVRRGAATAASDDGGHEETAGAGHCASAPLDGTIEGAHEGGNSNSTSLATAPQTEPTGPVAAEVSSQ